MHLLPLYLKSLHKSFGTLLFCFLLIGLFSYSKPPFQDCSQDDNKGYCILPSSKEERELLSNIHYESRRLYASLDCEGKNKAIELAKIYQDKNLAIQQAAKEMAKRQNQQYPNQKTYPKQIQERSGQYLYNDRFGY